MVLDYFDATIMEDSINGANLNNKDWEKDPDIKKPDKFSHSTWLAWEDMVYNYFTAMKNIRGLTLT